MVFEHIEKLKRQYTDKYVVVDAARPELARFRDATGVVKTINMNGRALVEFDLYDNIGWYDIELDFLKCVDKPLPKAEKKEEQPAKTAPTAGPATKAVPASKPGVPPKPKAEVAATAEPVAQGTKPATPAAGKKLSTADILAAARAKAGSTGGAATEKPTAEKPAQKPAAAPAATAAKPAGKLSTADILAAARATAAPPAATAPATTEESLEPAEEVAQAPAEVPIDAPPAARKPAAGGPLPATTADKIAWCRTHDAK